MGNKWRTTEVAVGVVGPSWSGKTVLLTSLINHLESHDPRHFAVGKPGTGISRFRHEARADAGWTLFPYREFRNRLVHARWPDKTRDSYQYVCSFERSDWKYSDVLLKLYDLPGERINDVAMVRRDFGSYERWSDHVLQQLRDDVVRVEAFDSFFKRIDDPNVDEPTLMGAYRLGLARLWLSYKHFLTPSTFLLDLEGKSPRGRDPEQLAAVRYAGLSPTEEFAPLPLAARARNSAMAERFANRFERYRDWIVAPWVRTLKRCHGLVIMVDVLEVLASGRHVYNDHRQFLEELFTAIDPRNSWFDDLLDKFQSLLPYQLRRSWIRRVAFVASKLDRVYPDDRKRVGHLLEQMVRKFRGDLASSGIEADLFRVAAVRSTEQAPPATGSRQLLGRTMRDERGARVGEPGEKRIFSVAEVPDTWPNEWGEGEFYFPEVFPYIPPRLDAAPDQEGLDHVFNFLCR